MAPAQIGEAGDEGTITTARGHLQAGEAAAPAIPSNDPAPFVVNSNTGTAHRVQVAGLHMAPALWQTWCGWHFSVGVEFTWMQVEPHSGRCGRQGCFPRQLAGELPKEAASHSGSDSSDVAVCEEQAGRGRAG